MRLSRRVQAGRQRSSRWRRLLRHGAAAICHRRLRLANARGDDGRIRAEWPNYRCEPYGSGSQTTRGSRHRGRTETGRKSACSAASRPGPRQCSLTCFRLDCWPWKSLQHSYLSFVALLLVICKSRRLSGQDSLRRWLAGLASGTAFEIKISAIGCKLQRRARISCLAVRHNSCSFLAARNLRSDAHECH